MLAVIVLVLGVLAAECSDIHEENEIISELTDAMQKMKARVTEIEKAMDLMVVDNQRLKSKIDKIEEYRGKE